jgi:hypothetical protein
VTEEERTRILWRAIEGPTAAIRRAAKLGRKPKLDDHHISWRMISCDVGPASRDVAYSIMCQTAGN